MFNFFTKKEAEALLEVSAPTLESFIESGELECFMINGRVRISEQHIDNFRKRGGDHEKVA